MNAKSYEEKESQWIQKKHKFTYLLRQIQTNCVITTNTTANQQFQ